MSTPVRMPPKGEWYTYLFKDRGTKLTHAVITLKRNYKRKPGSLANCGAPILGMWHRPTGGITCPKCVGIYDALDVLLKEE